MQMGPTQALASFSVKLRYSDLPAAVTHEAKRAVLNWFGVAVGAARHPTTDIAIRTVTSLSTGAEARILGRDERTDLLNAAFVNGTSSHVFDFDDTHLSTIVHPSGPVAAALFALAERRQVSGRELVSAFVAGVDVECRLAKAVYPSHYDIGFHITGTTGVFGATAAAGRLLSLDERAMAQAFGIAASQAAGLREMFGTMTKPFHVGKAAQNGLFAALLASHGFTSSTSAIEGRRGFAAVLARDHDFAPIYDELGSSFELSNNSYKPFACGIVVHPTIDGCVQLARRHRPCVNDIEAIELEVHPLVLELTGNPTPATGLQGKFSVHHCAAVAVLDGEAGEAQFQDDRVSHPDVVALRQRVRPVPNDGIREDEAVVRLTMRSGDTHEAHVEHAIGSLDRPMKDGELNHKFELLTRPILGRHASDRLRDRVWQLDALGDASTIIDAAVPETESLQPTDHSDA